MWDATEWRVEEAWMHKLHIYRWKKFVFYRWACSTWYKMDGARSVWKWQYFDRQLECC